MRRKWQELHVVGATDYGSSHFNNSGDAERMEWMPADDDKSNSGGWEKAMLCRNEN
jgi:hypothetical protein